MSLNVAARATARRNLVLVGGGHAHLEVLRRWIATPIAGVDLTLIVDRPRCVYSGMVPGFVAGDYEREDIEIDVAALARAATARVLEGTAISLEPGTRRFTVAPVAAAAAPTAAAATVGVEYDLASLDVGSSVRGLELPGVYERALSTRPIGEFVRRVRGELDKLRRGGSSAPRIVIVGGGVAAFELAFTLGSRVRNSGAAARIIIVSEDEQGVASCAPRRSRSILREAARRGVAVVHGRACAVDSAGVRLAAHAPATDAPPLLDADLVVWASGAAAPPLASRSRLPLDARGFVRVRSSLQVVGHDDLFAAGDCASIDGAPWVPKAGVYAVRQGPLLDANLRARLTGRPLRDYRPQRDFLSIVNLGERRALAAKWSLSMTGRLPWLLKDRIDRRFVARYRSAAQPLRRIL